MDHVAGYTVRNDLSAPEQAGAGESDEAGRQAARDGLDAYRWEDPTGFNTLPDRLMRALEAGSIAGGDVRCNNETTRQTAALAFIVGSAFAVGYIVGKLLL